MKKVLLILMTLIILALASLYIFIPSKNIINLSIKTPANREALFRKLGVTSHWREWWPEKQDSDTASVLLLHKTRFQPGPPKTLSIPISINGSGLATACELTLIALGNDSTLLHVETAIPNSTNPFKRIGTYSASENLENDLSLMLQAIDTSYSKIVNLYDYDIRKEKVVDSILVFTSEETTGYPSPVEVYALIDKLKAYIQKNAATETGFPMQNIYTTDSIHYQVKVAIPVNKRLPDSGKISYRWMLGGGNILITEVKGGPYSIANAYKQVLNYISDHARIAPAISFESLVTDRRKETDSSKWVTKIYHPVM